MSWRDNLIDQLRECSIDNSVGYVVPGHPMLGDRTMQFLLEADDNGEIELEFYDEPIPILLTETLAMNGTSPAFVDALTLLEISRNAPFSAGMFPASTSQSIIITNVTPGINGSDVARILSRRYRLSTPVRLVPMTGELEQVELSLRQIQDEASGFAHYLLIPAVSGDDFQRSADDLQRLVARLRAPDGCPWDREQSNQSLSRNLIEESYELLDAVAQGDSRALREELGDFLLQAFLHSQITEENEQFTFEDVVQTLIDKLVRRHPHVFASANAENADEVVQSWDEIKRAERAARPTPEKPTPLGDIPTSMPALLRAQSVIKRAARSNLGEQVLREHESAAIASIERDEDRNIVAELVKLMHLAQNNGVDAEQALRQWTRQFETNVANVTDQRSLIDRS
jgi:tetrapyrrole methylase family protein / MazG family protein